jgi:predicted nucleic acid-binding protein
VGEVDYYLDASFIVALLTLEPSSSRAVSFSQQNPAPPVASDLAAAEFASAISRRVRMRELTRRQGQFALTTFDDWAAERVRWIEVAPVDIAVATGSLRRLDLSLRTADAIHVAVAQRLGATLVTFDQRMAAVARALGIAVTEP